MKYPKIAALWQGYFKIYMYTTSINPPLVNNKVICISKMDRARNQDVGSASTFKHLDLLTVKVGGQSDLVSDFYIRQHRVSVRFLQNVLSFTVRALCKLG